LNKLQAQSMFTHHQSSSVLNISMTYVTMFNENFVVNIYLVY